MYTKFVKKKEIPFLTFVFFFLFFSKQQCEREYNVGKLQLRDILSVPMQRILKYHLLLDKLVKETSPV